MLDADQRRAILRLANQGHGVRRIARALGVGRNTVRRVLRSGQGDVPALERPERLLEHIAQVKALHESCEGNLVRVCEELRERGMDTAYSSLTAFCRRHGIGVREKKRAGRYHFEPGQEMQHDTSPHAVTIGGRRRTVHCASLVLCWSRKTYAQVYPRWSRFECRVFLSEAIVALGGAAGQCMLDNSSVVIARGRGKDAVPADVMLALAERFGFIFRAHEVGDANRSARVERPFAYIERNFYPGRTFADLGDLNAQLRDWCERIADRHRRELGTTPRELWVSERPHLQPLPIYVPEVYDVHTRRVDVEGYVSLHTNRYSAPTELIGRRVTVRESANRVRVYDGHACVAEHERAEHGARERLTLPEHAGYRRKREPPPPSNEERVMRAVAPELGTLLDLLRKKRGGRARRPIRRLYRIYVDYPTEPVIEAIRIAVEHELIDLERIERMVLRRIAGDFFRLPLEEEPNGTTKKTDNE